MGATAVGASRNTLDGRFVRYVDLRPCTTAFIDARTPGSDRKENFTIIGPGVAENPDQHVHVTIAHGFNIGGARQPPRCVNSQHSHESAEVFVILSGLWRMRTGHDGTDGYVDMGPGDVISFPTQMFRGFENIGSETGFLFSVLGGDDPGRVTWAPYVFEAARAHGLVLLESGRLIDTARETVPPDAKRMPATTPEDVRRFIRVDSAAAEKIVARAAQFEPAGGGLNRCAGIEECPIVGVASPAENIPAGPLAWAHGFQVRALRTRPEATTGRHVRTEEEVLLGHTSTLTVRTDEGELTVGPGDTLSIPAGITREFVNASREQSMTYVVRAGDYPAAPRWLTPHVFESGAAP